MKLVKVIWRDIHGLDSGWKTKDELVKLSEEKYKQELVSVGYLVSKSKKFIVLAATHDGDMKSLGLNDASMIPTKDVKRIIKLKDV